MNNRKTGITDPFFNEFVYHCIVTASPETVNKLPTQLLTFTHTKQRIKRFADKASLEQKIEMLSRLGVGCAVFFSLPEYLKTESIQATYKAFKEDNRLADLNSMIAQKGFCFTSREVMAVLAVKAMNCHSETYLLNREYSTLAAEIIHAKDIDRKVKDIELVKESVQDHKLIATLLLNNLLLQPYVYGQTAYTVRELKMLLFLYVRRKSGSGFDNYTSLETVQKHFALVYTKQRVSLTLSALHHSLHIDRFPGRRLYAISGTGIEIITSYIARLINQTLNF